LIAEVEGSLCDFGGELVEIDQSAFARDVREGRLFTWITCRSPQRPIRSSSAAAIVMVPLDI
jgi:hypothetical protein